VRAVRNQNLMPLEANRQQSHSRLDDATCVFAAIPGPIAITPRCHLSASLGPGPSDQQTVAGCEEARLHRFPTQTGNRDRYRGAARHEGRQSNRLRSASIARDA
jgi:hypothetical protein